MATVVGVLIVSWLGVSAWQALWPLVVARWPALVRWRRQGLWSSVVVLALLALWLIWGALPDARLSAAWSRLELERVQFWSTLLLLPWLGWWAWRADPLWRWRPLRAASVLPMPAPGKGGEKGKKKRRR